MVARGRSALPSTCSTSTSPRSRPAARRHSRRSARPRLYRAPRPARVPLNRSSSGRTYATRSGFRSSSSSSSCCASSGRSITATRSSGVGAPLPDACGDPRRPVDGRRLRHSACAPPAHSGDRSDRRASCRLPAASRRRSSTPRRGRPVSSSRGARPVPRGIPVGPSRRPPRHRVCRRPVQFGRRARASGRPRVAPREPQGHARRRRRRHRRLWPLGARRAPAPGGSEPRSDRLDTGPIGHRHRRRPAARERALPRRRAEAHRPRVGWQRHDRLRPVGSRSRRRPRDPDRDPRGRSGIGQRSRRRPPDHAVHGADRRGDRGDRGDLVDDRPAGDAPALRGRKPGCRAVRRPPCRVPTE